MAETKFECLDCGKRVCDTPDGVCSKCKKSGDEQEIRKVLEVLNPDIPSE
jgi:hypothetical protein